MKPFGVQNALAFALMHLLVGPLLTCAPEPPPEERERLLFIVLPLSAPPLTEAEIRSLMPPSVFAPPPLRAAVEFRRPPTAAGLEKSLFTASLIGYVGLNIADYLASREILKTLGPDELNPMTKAFAKNEMALFAFKFGYTLMSVFTLKEIHRADKPMAWALSLIGSFLVSYTLAFSLEQLKNSRNDPPAER